MSLLDLVTDAIQSGRLSRTPRKHEDEAHVMEVMDHTGHKFLTWDPDVPSTVEEARQEFDRLRRQGYQAFRLNVQHQDGVLVEEDGEVIDRFDPTAGRLMMSPRQRGG